MNQRFAPLTPEIANDWDKLVEGSPDGWAFSLSGWQRLILAVEQWQLRDHSFALYDSGRLAAVVPLQWNPHARRMSSTGWGGSGPVLASYLDAHDRRRVLNVATNHARDIAVEHGAAVLDLSISPVTETSITARWGVNPFVDLGFNDVSQTSQVVDLSARESELLEHLSTLAKRLLRKASEAKIEVRRVNWLDFVDAYYDIHQETYIRTGVSPHPKSYFDGIAREMAPNGHSVLFAAFSRSGEPIAFNNSSRFRIGAVYHTGCSRASALKVGANYLLMWHAILSAKRDGYRWFEVGPIFPHTDVPKLKGLTDFKTKFGGEPHRFFRCEMPLTATGDSTGACADAGMTDSILQEPQMPPWRRLLRRPRQILRCALGWRG